MGLASGAEAFKVEPTFVRAIKKHPSIHTKSCRALAFPGNKLLCLARSLCSSKLQIPSALMDWAKFRLVGLSNPRYPVSQPPARYTPFFDYKPNTTLETSKGPPPPPPPARKTLNKCPEPKNLFGSGSKFGLSRGVPRPSVTSLVAGRLFHTFVAPLL